MITTFGKFCRKLRIDNGEILKHMADKLGVTSSYLSAVENGKRKIPDEWLEMIIGLYDLDNSMSRELETAFMDSQSSFTFKLDNYNQEDKNILMAFARDFGEMDDFQKKEIKSILFKNRIGDN